MAIEAIQEKVITKRLGCLLSDEERLEFADQLAEANERVESAKSAKKSMMKQMQSEIDVAEAHRDNVNNIVASKTEYRDVDVRVVWNYDKGRIQQVRIDTGEMIVDRPMTQKEKQQNLLNDPELDE
jgi:glutathione peroxidase-family protein